MKTVSKGVLKAKMLEYLREIEISGEELIITDHNIPVLKIIPIEHEKKTTNQIFKNDRGKIRYFEEDITTPTSDEWKEL